MARFLFFMHWFLYICVGSFTYLLLVYFYGGSGVYAQESLEAYLNNLKSHVRELERNQNLLEEELASLYYSEEDLKLQVRKLGYFEEDENVFYFSLPNIKSNFYHEPPPLFNSPYKLFSNSFFVLASILVMLILHTLWRIIREFFKTFDCFKLWIYQLKGHFKRFFKKLSQLTHFNVKN